MNDIKTFITYAWNCKYHIVFAPKYRRKIFYGEKRYEIGKILRELCDWNGITIIKAEACPAYAGGDTAENECVELCGFSEMEKQFDGLQTVEQYKVQVPQQRVLVQGLLYRYRGQ